MTARLRLAAGVAAMWRVAPVRGPGRVLDALVLQHPEPGEAEVAWAGGRLAVAFHNPPEVSAWLWQQYEPDVTAAIRALLPPSGTAVDVGSNCGVHTLTMRAAVGPSGRVLAVDPSPRACVRVRKQADINGYRNVDVLRAGLGAEATAAVFRFGTVGIGALSAVDTEFTSDEEIEVQVRPLDDVLAERSLAPDLIKIDTDGGEVEVLAGAEGTLKDCRPALVFELYPEGLARHGTTVGALDAAFERFGYALAAPILHDRARAFIGPPRFAGFRPIDRLTDAPPGNVVAVHRDDARGYALRPAASR